MVPARRLFKPRSKVKLRSEALGSAVRREIVSVGLPPPGPRSLPAQQTNQTAQHLLEGAWADLEPGTWSFSVHAGKFCTVA